MLSVQGVYAQEQFVRKHPKHWGIGKLRSEAIEGWVGLCKLFQKKHGNYGIAWLRRLRNFLDLYCIGAVQENLIDFAQIERKHLLYQKLIYDKHTTDAIQLALESALPPRCIYFLNLIDSIQFKGNIPAEIQTIIIPDFYTSQRMQHIRTINTNDTIVYADSSDSDSDSTDDDTDSTDEPQFNPIAPTKRMNRRQLLERRQQNDDDDESDD